MLSDRAKNIAAMSARRNASLSVSRRTRRASIYFAFGCPLSHARHGQGVCLWESTRIMKA